MKNYIDRLFDEATNTINGVVSFFNIFEILDEKVEEQRDSLLEPRTTDKRMSISNTSPEVKKAGKDHNEKNKRSIKRTKKKADSGSDADSESDDSTDSEQVSTPTFISRQSTSETLEDLKENLATLNGRQIDEKAINELKKIMEDRKKLKDPTDKNYPKNVEEFKEKIANSNSLPPSRDQSPEQSPINSPREEEGKIKNDSKVLSPKFKMSDKFGSIKGRFKHKDLSSQTSSVESSSMHSPKEDEDKVEHGSKVLSPKFKVSDKFGSIKGVFKYKDKSSNSASSSKEPSPVNSPREEENKVKHGSKISSSKSKVSNKFGSVREVFKHKEEEKIEHENRDSGPKSKTPQLTSNKFEYSKEFGDDIKNPIKPAKLIKSKDDYIGSVIQPAAGSKFGQPPKKLIVEDENEDTVKLSDIDPDAKSFGPIVMNFSIENLKNKATMIDMGVDNKIKIDSEDEYSDGVFNNDPSEEYNSENLALVIQPIEKVNEASIIDDLEIHNIAGNGSLIVSKTEL